MGASGKLSFLPLATVDWLENFSALARSRTWLVSPFGVTWLRLRLQSMQLGSRLPHSIASHQ